MFDANSRYYSLEVYHVQDARGRKVPVVPAPPEPNERLLGRHLLKQGQRPDHLAYKYLKDAAAFWRLCEINDAMLPEALSERREIAIPQRFPRLF